MIQVTSLQPIIDCMSKEYRPWGATEISLTLGMNRQLVHRYCTELLRRGIVSKVGAGPHTKYVLNEKPTESKKDLPLVNFSYKQIQLLEQWFYKFAPNGQILKGKEGFIQRCVERNLDPTEKVKSFCKLIDFLSSQKNKDGLLDVTQQIRGHIQSDGLDQLFYADQYKWMEFGRGKLAEMTFYAKDTQNLSLIKQSVHSIINQLENLIQEGKFDAVCFAPHSKKREIQLLKILEKTVNTHGLPVVKLVKYAPHGILIAQKSLKTREQRIQNARETILIEDISKLKNIKNILLIDDFVGSGATLNEIAKKFKHHGVKKVVGFAFVGNANLSYEVINEI